MFDHVTIRVSDRATSERFYDTVLAQIGADQTYGTWSFVMWHDFLLTESDAEHAVTRDAEIAFAAPSREQVDGFFEAAGDAGDEPPMELEDGTYRAGIRDPDGNRLLAVDAGRTAPPRERIVEHVVLRVGDLAASARFYDVVAAAVGEDLRTSLSLVEMAPPTQNLHLAFAGDDEAVKRFHAQATTAGFPDNGEPGERPQYHRGYYAAYVLDPDGNNVEVVDHHLTR